jgi:DUF1680 family protein
VVSNHGQIALQRGSLVYCLEAADQPGVELRDIRLRVNSAWQMEWKPELLGGLMVGHGEAELRAAPGQSGPLYAPASAAVPSAMRGPITAIPYYAWANREPGQMRVWLPVVPGDDVSEESKKVAMRGDAMGCSVRRQEQRQV